MITKIVKDFSLDKVRLCTVLMYNTVPPLYKNVQSEQQFREI